MFPATRFVSLPACARPADQSVTHPAGFRASGIVAGLKRSGRRDLGILVSDQPCVSAVAFTRNAAAAAPVRLTRDHCACERLRAVVVNSGNANVITGEQGLRDALRMRQLAADSLRLPLDEVAVCSTGVMGVPLPMELIETGVAMAAAKLSPAHGDDFAVAIRTTDRTAKHGALTIELERGEVRLGVAAKGAGMISPNMATMLCFVTTDAVVEGPAWQALVSATVAESFNRITVDGQESTNDTVVALANGASGMAATDADLESLARALGFALKSCAIALVADGEGSTRTVRLTVTGAQDGARAEAVARAVANSPLVKAAFYGGDPNGGRVLQAVGQVLGRPAADGLVADVAFGGLTVVRGGEMEPLGDGQRVRLAGIMAEPEIDLSVKLAAGAGTATLFFSDLTHRYVTINAEYST